MSPAPQVTAVPKQETRPAIQRAMSAAYRTASHLRSLRDDSEEVQRLGIGNAVHDCRKLVERLEGAYKEMSGSGVPDRKALAEERRRMANRPTETEREALTDLVKVMDQHISRLGGSRWQGQFQRCQARVSEVLDESSTPPELRVVKGGSDA